MSGSESVRRWDALMVCPVHGLTEATMPMAAWPDDSPTGTTVDHCCPVSIGEDSSCGLSLDRAEPVVAVSDSAEQIEWLRKDCPYAGEWSNPAWHAALDAVAERLGLDREEIR